MQRFLLVKVIGEFSHAWLDVTVRSIPDSYRKSPVNQGVEANWFNVTLEVLFWQASTKFTYRICERLDDGIRRFKRLS
jgi:hypothetical protein